MTADGTLDFGEALAEIRLAESMRMLGMLEAHRLRGQAIAWRSAGISSANVRELSELPEAAGLPESAGPAGTAVGTTTSSPAALLEATAAELDLGFSSVQDARAFHVRAVLANPAAGIPGSNPLDISNNFTDHVTGTATGALRGLADRLRRRKR